MKIRGIRIANHAKEALLRDDAQRMELQRKMIPTHRTNRGPLHELLEPRQLLTAISFSPHEILLPSVEHPRSVYAADIDLDGDMDILTASYGDGKIAWYENENGRGFFGAQKIISDQAEGASAVRGADIDGDGDIDVVSASERDNKIAWYRNEDGHGSFSSEQIITTMAEEASAVQLADLDGDGDLDVLSASGRDDKIAWYTNLDGLGQFGEQLIISEGSDGGFFESSLSTGDFDKDGDLDVVATSLFDDRITWYENLDGRGQFHSGVVVSTAANAPTSVVATDIDGDGDLDLFATPLLGGPILQFSNIGTRGNFDVKELTWPSWESWETTRFSSIRSADLDSDGDQDLVFTVKKHTWGISRNGVYWLENLDGAGTLSEPNSIQTPTSTADPRSLDVADIDGDGLLDVVAASWFENSILWYETQITEVSAEADERALTGDANGDGTVNFPDFLLLTSNFGNTNATWRLGDFDGDQQVGFSDFLLLSRNFGRSALSASASNMDPEDAHGQSASEPHFLIDLVWADLSDDATNALGDAISNDSLDGYSALLPSVSKGE